MNRAWTIAPRLGAAFLLLSGGCTSVYGADVPVGCEEDDADGDGYLAAACLPVGSDEADCDDDDPDIHPGAPERCNDVDDDCDLRFDEGVDTAAFYPDCDGDGAGAGGPVLMACDVALRDAPSCEGGAWVEVDGDCDDDDADVHPGASERCNDADDDCDGVFDEDVVVATYYPDCDGDGAGAARPFAETCDVDLLEAPSCDGGSGDWVDVDGDCDDTDPTRQLSCDSCGSVDLLLVIDDTDSMAGHQTRFAAVLPGVVQALATGDLDGDGTEDTEPVADFQLGVITTDMGSRGFDYPSCVPADFGDDGILITSTEDPSPECDRTFPRFLGFDPEGTDVETLTDDAVCMATVGTNGCVFEQPLEAALKALTPAASPIRFHPGMLGHGDLHNDGFLRDDSVLALTVLTDEDDCSVDNAELFDPTSTAFGEPTNVRCAVHPEALLGIERYTSGFLALRPAEDLVFTLVAGVPQDRASLEPTVADYEAVQTDARMVPIAGPDDGTQLFPSCSRAGGTVYAVPPVRLVELGRSLTERGVRTVLGSICDPALDAIGAAMVDAALAARDRRCSAAD